MSELHICQSYRNIFLFLRSMHLKAIKLFEFCHLLLGLGGSKGTNHKGPTIRDQAKRDQKFGQKGLTQKGPTQKGPSQKGQCQKGPIPKGTMSKPVYLVKSYSTIYCESHIVNGFETNLTYLNLT